jgi:hypothetical protein
MKNQVYPMNADSRALPCESRNSAIDSLLKIRSEFTTWVDAAIGRAREREMRAYEQGRMRLGAEPRLEAEILDDVQEIVLDMIDRELRGWTRTDGSDGGE